MKNLVASLMAAGSILLAGSASAAVSYSSDPNLADFASNSTTFATLSNYSAGDVGTPTYATTYADLQAGLRVYDGGSITGLSNNNNWILATFASPVSDITVYSNIDHFGSDYDGYQYTIQGSNDGTTWTPLFDALTVTGGGEPFTLGTYTGTAPTAVNNVLTPGAGPAGTVGYIADFSFGTSYSYYAFGASTEAFNSGNSDQELSGVAAGALVQITGGGAPEPFTWAMLLVGFGTLGFMIRGKRRNEAATA